MAGGFDGFDTHRAQYLHPDEKGVLFIEKVLRYASKFQESQNSDQLDIFGGGSEVQIPEPEVPPCEEWGTLKKLKQEKEVVGIYISGHPLDDFKTEINRFCNCTASDFNNLENFINREMCFGGMVGDVQHRETKMGKGWALFIVEDYNESYEFRIFGEQYLKFRHFLVPNSFIFIKALVKDGWVNKETQKKGDPRLQFNSMQMLQEVMDSHTKKLTIQLPIEEVNDGSIANLKEIIASHKGDKHLELLIYEASEKIKVTMPSKKFKIDISNELLKKLEDEQIMYKLN